MIAYPTASVMAYAPFKKINKQLMDSVQAAHFPLKDMDAIRAWFSLHENYVLLKAHVLKENWRKSMNDLRDSIMDFVVSPSILKDPALRWVPLGK